MEVSGVLHSPFGRLDVLAQPSLEFTKFGFPRVEGSLPRCQHPGADESKKDEEDSCPLLEGEIRHGEMAPASLSRLNGVSQGEGLLRVSVGR